MGFKRRDISVGAESSPARRSAADLSATLPTEAWAATVRHGQNALLFANDEQRFVYANPAATRLLGYSLEEFLSMSIWDLTPSPDVAAGQASWARFLEEGAQRGEYRVCRKDGVLRIFEYSAVANIVPGIHLSDLHDVTELVQAEQMQRDRVEEKKLFLRETQHRIKNILATVIALMRMQASLSESLSAEDLIARVTSRVQAMAMSANTRLGCPADTDTCSANELLDSVARATVESIALQSENVHCTVIGDECEISWESSDPLALIVNEVLSNYIQHSTSVGDLVEVRIRLEGHENGLDALEIDFDRPFSSPPESWQPHFGIRLLDRLARQLRGTVEWRQGDEEASFHLALECSP